MAAAEAEEKKALETTLTIDGVTLQVKDIFPDSWEAKRFLSARNLSRKAKGGDSSSTPAPVDWETDLFVGSKSDESDD